MSTNETATRGAKAGAPVAKDAPTEQQASQAGAPKRFERGQTVCNEKDAKGKPCNGHLKQVSPVREEARQHMRGDDLLYRCQTCGTLYMGPPLGHVRDPRKQGRYVQRELVAILEAAGGTLPAFKQNEKGAWVPASETSAHAPAPAAASAQNIKPAPPVKPAATTAVTPASVDGETPEQKRARIIAEAKAKAAARMAGGGAPASSADAAPAASSSAPASSAAPAASGDETAEERRARIMAEAKAKAAARMAAAKGTTSAPGETNAVESAATHQVEASAQGQTTAQPPVASAGPNPPAPISTDVPADETPEQKRARMMAEIKAKAAAKMAAKGGARTGGETAIDVPPTTAQPPSPTSGTDSSAAADAHRPAAEAQASTGQASAAPLSPAAATASPAAGAETPADLAPDASTELTPGAPRDERNTDEGANG
ncbi:MAG TPA: hypothetical protein VF656_10085 [Pyrinomonadaceae bacterium]|jgi:hypothetical protein